MGSLRQMSIFSAISIAFSIFLLPSSLEVFGVSKTLIIMAAFLLPGLVLAIMWAETKQKQLR